LVLVVALVVFTAVDDNSDDEDDDDDDDSQNESSSQNEQPPSAQQSQVTWRTFNDREGLFTVQFPSNWTPSNVAEVDRSGPIDSFFSSPGATGETGAEIEFIQYAQPSVFSTSQEALESEINTLQNDPTVTKFEIERPVECAMFILNGLQACSYIYEVRTTDGPNLAVLAVDAVAPDGTEYEVYYRSDFNSFQHYLPAAESMIRSFQTTGSGSDVTNFSLGGSSNTTRQQNSSSSSDDDFSLG